MNTIKIWNDSPSPKQVADIANCIREGMLVVMPTDTMYGVMADALNQKAVERVCRLKGINPDKTNLSIICSDISMAAEYARVDNKGFKLLKENTPGAFTFLFKTTSNLPRAFKGRKTVGIRIPDSQVCREVAEYLGTPMITTSIVYEDEDHAVNPELIAETYYNSAELMVEGDDGSLEKSTIVDCTTDDIEIVRQGKGELKV